LSRFPKPDVILGQHVMPMSAGIVASQSGVVTSAGDSFEIRMFGRGAWVDAAGQHRPCRDGGLYRVAAADDRLVVIAYHAGDHTLVFPIVGAGVCFLMRMVGLRYGIGLPAAADVAARARLGRGRR
jgi:hypothetical protein